MSELVDELIGLLRPAAEEPDCVAEVEHAREIVRRGTSADMQLRIYRDARDSGADDGEARREVARWLVEATLEGVEV
jgi:carboxylate-amine ligase